jgi:excisionase family DNA binding protein
MEILTTKQVAKLLGVKLYMVYTLIRTHNLPYIRLGRNYVFLVSSILQWKETEDKRRAETADTLSTKQIASMLSVSIAKVYHLVRTQGLPCKVVKWGNRNRYFFIEEEVFIWLVSQEQNKPAETQITEMLEAVA